MKSPAFQFYAAEFLADENVALMSNQEVGCYIKLICYCWREGSIPADIHKIAKLCGEDGSAMAQLWLGIGSCFELAIADPSRLVHHRLEVEREKQEAHRKERSESGKKGAKAKWGAASGLDGSANGSANGSAINQPMADDGSASASSSSSSSSTSEKAKSKDCALASRLPADWQPSAEDVLFCKTNRTDLNHATVADAFRDYWIGIAGAKGRKLDWPATWRNWVRGQKQQPSASGYVPAKSRHDAFMQKLNSFGEQGESKNERDITGVAVRVDS